MRNQAVSDSNHSAKHILIIIGLTAVYRALFIGSFQVSTDEAWFWLWSTRLDWGYIDHPPLVAYVVWLLRHAFGEMPWLWRSTSIVLSGASAWLLFCAGRLLFGPRAGLWSAVAFAASPLYTILGLLLLPDSLLVFWTCVAVYCAAKLVQSGRLWWFYPLGLAFGLGTLSNLPGLLIPTGLVLFGLLSKPHRYWFGRKEPYLGVLLGLLIIAPMVCWNWQHDWASVRYVLERVGEPIVLPLAWQFVVGQATCHSPLLWVCLCGGLLVGLKRTWVSRDRRMLLLLCLSLPLLLIYAVVSVSGNTQIHWPAAAYPAALVLVAGLIFREGFRWTRGRRVLAALTIGLAAATSALMLLLMGYPMLSMASKQLEKVVSLHADAVEPLAQSEGWGQEIRDGLLEMGRRHAAENAQQPVLLTHRNVLAALLDYYIGDSYEVISVHAQARQYNIWFDDDDLVGRAVLFVSTELFECPGSEAGRPEDYYVFDECHKQTPVIEVVRHGVTINRVHAWLCTGYAGPVAESARSKQHGP